MGDVRPELACFEGRVTLHFYIIPMTECTGDEFPLGAQNRITSVILPYLVIENTQFTSPGNTSCGSSGLLPACVSASLSFNIGSEKICCGVAAKPARPLESSAPGWEQENPVFSDLLTSPGGNPIAVEQLRKKGKRVGRTNRGGRGET